MHHQVDDERLIRRQIELYAHSADRREPAITAGVFVADGVLQIYTGDPNEGGTLDRERNGRAEIETAMGGLARYRATLHVLGQSSIDVHGSEAVSETYCTAHHLTDHDNGTVTDRFMAIRYLDRFDRTSHGWRLSRRREAKMFLP